VENFFQTCKIDCCWKKFKIKLQRTRKNSITFHGYMKHTFIVVKCIAINNTQLELFSVFLLLAEKNDIFLNVQNTSCFNFIALQNGK